MSWPACVNGALKPDFTVKPAWPRAAAILMTLLRALGSLNCAHTPQPHHYIHSARFFYLMRPVRHNVKSGQSARTYWLGGASRYIMTVAMTALLHNNRSSHTTTTVVPSLSAEVIVYRSVSILTGILHRHIHLAALQGTLTQP